MASWISEESRQFQRLRSNRFRWLRTAESRLQRRTENCAFGVSEFFVAAMVAAIVDEFLGYGFSRKKSRAQ